MTLGHEYLILLLAIVIMAMNILGAAFTIRRVHVRRVERAQAHEPVFYAQHGDKSRNHSEIDVANLQSERFATTAALTTFFLFEFLVTIQTWLAYRDGFLTPSQMQESGINAGLPFIWHFGMWGDLLIISPLAAYIVGRFFRSWRVSRVVVSLIVAFALSGLMSWSYLSSNVPEAHVQNHQLTSVGWVHLLYMAFALAIFVQFFLFTNDIPSALLRIVSALLVIHVFLGTHMVLGLYDLYHPLGWYPAQPLRSYQGWGVIGAVATTLFWRNLGTEPMILTYVFLTMENPTTAEGYLKFLNRLSDLTITTTYFFKIFFSNLEQGLTGLPLGLLLVIASKYFFSRVSVKQELEIGKTLYPPGKVPDILMPTSRREITFRVIGFLILYFFLGTVSNHLLIASFILAVIACNDVRTRFDIASNILKTFSDEAYMPDKSNPDYEKIMARRDVARWYLDACEQPIYQKPTYIKEGLCAFGCIIAFGFAAFGYLTGKDFDSYGYVILIATLVLNEVITVWWRIERFRRLLKIDPAPSLGSFSLATHLAHMKFVRSARVI